MRASRDWALLPARSIALVLSLLLGFGTQVSFGASDNSDIETRVKAAFIYNFARFIEWPSRPSHGSIRIGVMGRGSLATPLEEIVRGKSVNGQPIVINKVGAAVEADCCDILLIERSETKHLKEIVQSLGEKPVLTVCDGGNCIHDGMMIAFQIVDESVRFQINQEAAQHAGLKISSQLLKVAIPVTPGNHL